MSNEILVGIDLGTSSAKVVFINSTGKCLAHASRGYDIRSPFPGWAEQEPQVWLESVVSSICEVIHNYPEIGKKVTAIGLSGQMHGTVCLDSQCEPVCPAIIWADQRSGAQVNDFMQHYGVERMREWTGNPLFPGFMLSTLLWQKENQPHVVNKTLHVLLPKDFLRLKLCGTMHSESSDACSTGLFNVIRQSWNLDMIKELKLEEHVFPEIQASTFVSGYLTGAMARVTGLRAGIPIVTGGGDQACQAIGNGIVQPGTASCTIGTGGQLFFPIAVPVPDPALRTHLFCHVVPLHWYRLAATLSAGLSLRWIKELYFPGFNYNDMVREAEKAPPGCEGLLFLPYLIGERTPHMNPHARAAFVGLTLKHGREHLIRSVMEGVVFSLRQGLDIIRANDSGLNCMIASGGAARNPFWRQLVADIFELPVYRSLQDEAAAFGAALLAGVGVGVFRDLQDACSKTVKIDNNPTNPRPDVSVFYRKAYRRYRDLYPAFQAFMN